MSFLLSVLGDISAFLTDYLLTAVLGIAGIFLTVKTGFPQVKYFTEGIKNTFSGINSKEKTDGVSPFASLMTSLAAQLGTGNIVGAGSAIALGGPGAVFWMWVSAFFGMATSYSEGVLAQKTAISPCKKQKTGGAPFYISLAFRGKAGKFAGNAFSLFSTVALGFTGVAVQSNSIAVSLNEAFHIPFFISGIFLTFFAFLVLSGGTRTVTGFSEKTVPLTALLYIVGCLTVILKNIRFLPYAFYLIFTCAFSPEAVFGAMSGLSIKKAVSQGIKRGLFTNEAGMGSTSAVHAMSCAPSPHFQGSLGITGVFTDTFLMLSLTALSVVTVLHKNHIAYPMTITGSQAVSLAFSDVMGEKGASVFISLSVLFFAFASIIGWSTFGKASCIFLFGEKSTALYTFSSLAFVFTGTCMPGDIIWTLTDIFNTFMVVTNVPALIKLSPVVQTAYKNSQNATIKSKNVEKSKT